MNYNLFARQKETNSWNYRSHYTIIMHNVDNNSMEKNLAVAEDCMLKTNGMLVDSAKDNLFLNLLFFYRVEPDFIDSSVSKSFSEFNYAYHFSKSNYAKLLRDYKKNNKVTDIDLYSVLFKLNLNIKEAMPVIVNKELQCLANYSLFARNNSKLAQYNFSKYDLHDNKISFVTEFNNKFSVTEYNGYNVNDTVLKNNMSAEDIANLDSYESMNMTFAQPAGSCYYLITYNYGLNCAKYDIDIRDFHKDYNPAGYYFYAKSQKLQDKIVEVAKQAEAKALDLTRKYFKEKCC